MNHLTALSNSELLNQTRILVSRERELTAELLWHLREVERRRLYAEQGFSSLFDYVRRGLGYCEASADRRISAMRLLKDLPEVEPALKNGTLSLSNASALQHFFKREEKPRSAADKQEVLNNVMGKSRRECDVHLASLAPEAPKRDRSRAVSATQTEIRFTADEELMQMFEKLKSLLSHRNPNPSYAELFTMLAKLALKRLDPEQKPKGKADKSIPATPPAEVDPSNEKSRYIPQALRRAVWKRDQGNCSYVNGETQLRCGSRHLLEIHHIQDFSLGGRHTLENLTLRCQAHNLHTALLTHGSGVMSRYLR